jgi:hypothetical protein
MQEHQPSKRTVSRDASFQTSFSSLQINEAKVKRRDIVARKLPLFEKRHEPPRIAAS